MSDKASHVPVPVILTVESDDNLRMLLDKMLRDRFRVCTVSNGLDAMAWMAQGNVPDLILADMESPRLNGADLVHNLRVSGLYRHIPVLLLTGKSAEAEAAGLAQNGANGILCKPFSRESLFEAIGGILSKA
jgi:CheY-like chemotaxis protein